MDNMSLASSSVESAATLTGPMSEQFISVIQQEFEDKLHEIHLKSPHLCTHVGLDGATIPCPVEMLYLKPGKLGPVLDQSALINVDRLGHQSLFPSLFGRFRALPRPRPYESNELIELNVQSGIDVRTTLMMKNIPRDVNYGVLKHILEAYIPGRFDYLYLRYDFANMYNMGYAFLNVVAPEDILTLCKALRGKKWINSPKRIDFAYANLQGVESMVEKFRNSAVMNQHPAFRPHLLFAEPSDFAGHEREFPSPNNYAKFQRSLLNAGVVGLYSARSARFGRMGW